MARGSTDSSSTSEAAHREKIETTSDASKPEEAFIIQRSATELEFQNDGTETRSQEVRIQVLSEAGVQHWGVLSFSYQNLNQVLDIEYVRVKKRDGAVIATPTQDAQDITSEISRAAPFYTDQREKHIAVKGLAAGDVLEYSVSLRVIKPFIAGEFWLSYEFGHDEVVTEETLKISVPGNRAVKLKSRGPKFEMTNEGDRRIYRWSYSNPTGKSESDKDDGRIWKQVRGLRDQPDVLLSSFTSWEQVGRWYGELQSERVKPTPEIQAKVAELTKGATDDNSRLRALYDFVSRKFRYIGIALGMGRYQPHAASEVLENGYGDCKDKHTLLASLLTAAGFRISPALISSERDLDLDVPSPGQFNHVISVVDLPSGRLWLDTTPEVSPFGFLLSTLRGKHALVIPPDSQVALAITPENPDFKSSQSFTMKAKLDDAGTLTGDAERIISDNDFEVLLRAGFRNTPMPQWKDLVQNVSYSSGFGGDVSDVSASSPEDIEQPFRITYKYTRKDYSDWDNRRISPPLPLLYLPDIKEGQSAPMAPIWLGVPGEVKFYSSLELPKAYTLTLPSAVDVKEDFAEYHASYALKDGTLITDRRLVLMASEIPVSAYEKYKVFRKRVYVTMKF